MRVQLCLGLACWMAAVSCAGDTVRVRDEGLKKNDQGSALEGARALSAEESAGTAPASFTEAVARAHVQLASATPDDLARRTPKLESPAPADLSTVQYLDRILAPVSHGKANAQLALNEAERSKLAQNRFVSSERLGELSYAGLYHRIYEHDQPLFITADSVLHAFHMSYEVMLEELETEYLRGALDEVLTGMASSLPAAREAHEDDALHDAVRDADVFIAVGRSLLEGQDVPASDPQNNPRARAIVEAIDAQRVHRLTLFGYERPEDFTQLKPRGHYTHSVELERYFRAMMWLGRTELRVAGDRVPTSELAGAIVLHELLARARQLQRWHAIDRLIQTYVGPADAMNASQLGVLLGARSTGAALHAGELQALQQQIARAGLGAQEINSQLRYAEPEGSEPTRLPNAFAFFPQRFTVDSWVLSQLVFDRARYRGAPVSRELPSGVDVAFSALGNDHVAGLLAARIENEHGVPSRDGLPIQASLLATRAVIDARPSEAWTGNLYESWIGALRALSEPTVDARYPSVMRSEAWAQRRLQTQLASWAELRHDTILYVKQSYGMVLCEYPAGFVELQPAFWQRLEAAATLASGALQDIELPKAAAHLKGAHAAHWKAFAATVATLHGIAVKELKAEPMSARELKFLKNTVEVTEGQGCGGPPQWNGWFVKLYYGGSRDATEWGALVADVHTSPHEGVFTVATGGVDLTVAIIERGEHTMAFAGPTAQYWELVASDGVRMNDREWKDKLSANRAPPRPEWTSQWLVSGNAAYQSHPK